MEKPVLYIVVPCYNEEKVLPITSKLFLKKLKQLIADKTIAEGSRILLLMMEAKIQLGRLYKD